MLQELPFELLSQVVALLPTAQSVHHLSLCNHALHRFVEDEGWKIFVQTRFPSMPARDHWKEAAQSMTTLSRNIDRKAFLARYVEPSNFVVNLPHRELSTQWRKPRSQTMGYQPVIDSYEESSGSAWDARKQVLAWSAGSELVLRVKEMGGKSLVPERRGTYSYLDHYVHRTRWFTYKPPKAMEGRDDITCMKLLSGPYRAGNSSGSATEHVILGTASGNLHLSHLELDRSSYNTLGSVFKTDRRHVRSADLSPNDQQILAACLADTSIVLYKVPEYLYSAPEDHERISPCCERTLLLQPGKSHRIWSTKFLSDGLLALGLGPSAKPLHVYQITNEGLSKDPVRKFSMDATAWECDDRVAVPKPTKEKTTSVYPMIPLPWSSTAGHAPGEVFLSGCYDGIIRVHDMRSRSAFESTYFDPADDGAIYSLQTLGRERLAAGSSRHSIIKFFDLRVAGGRVYHYTDLGSGTADRLQSLRISTREVGRSGWNLFLNPRNQTQQSQRWQRAASRATESPVYSLSSPSPTSPSLFAGVENNIVELDFVSMLDKHPDPIFARGLVRDIRGNINVARSWNPKGDVLNFAMIEHTKTVRLRTQAGVGKYAGVIAGYDERWREGS
jgi:WD40 repeat protein